MMSHDRERRIHRRVSDRFGSFFGPNQQEAQHYNTNLQADSMPVSSNTGGTNVYDMGLPSYKFGEQEEESDRSRIVSARKDQHRKVQMIRRKPPPEMLPVEDTSMREEEPDRTYPLTRLKFEHNLGEIIGTLENEINLLNTGPEHSPKGLYPNFSDNSYYVNSNKDNSLDNLQVMKSRRSADTNYFSNDSSSMQSYSYEPQTGGYQATNSSSSQNYYYDQQYADDDFPVRNVDVVPEESATFDYLYQEEPLNESQILPVNSSDYNQGITNEQRNSENSFDSYNRIKDNQSTKLTSSPVRVSSIMLRSNGFSVPRDSANSIHSVNSASSKAYSADKNSNLLRQNTSKQPTSLHRYSGSLSSLWSPGSFRHVSAPTSKDYPIPLYPGQGQKSLYITILRKKSGTAYNETAPGKWKLPLGISPINKSSNYLHSGGNSLLNRNKKQSGVELKHGHLQPKLLTVEVDGNEDVPIQSKIPGRTFKPTSLDTISTSENPAPSMASENNNIEEPQVLPSGDGLQSEISARRESSSSGSLSEVFNMGVYYHQPDNISDNRDAGENDNRNSAHSGYSPREPHSESRRLVLTNPDSDD